jgi:hypothetical protein
MKIEIIITESINEEYSDFTCFNAEPYIAKALTNTSRVNGICIINDVAVKFTFYPPGMDGEIFSSNSEHRLLVKTLIPVYVYNKVLGKSLRMKRAKEQES